MQDDVSHRPMIFEGEGVEEFRPMNGVRVCAVACGDQWGGCVSQEVDWIGALASGSRGRTTHKHTLYILYGHI